MKKLLIFITLFCVAVLNAGNPCPDGTNCNFGMQHIKGMQIREIKIYAPQPHAVWKDVMYHKIKWKWVPKSKKPKKHLNAVFYLVRDKERRAVKLFSQHPVLGFKPNRIYSVNWYIDTKSYKFPGYFRIKIVLDGKVYGESGKFRIAKALYTKTIKLKPKIINRHLCKGKHRQNPITLDKAGPCVASALHDKSIMRAGFENSYMEYGPFNENYARCNCFYRGYLVFDLSTLNPKESKILKGHLHLRKVANSGCTAGNTATNNCNCIKEIDYFSRNGKIAFNTPAQFYSKAGSDQNYISISVGNIVRKKLYYGAKKIGFKVVGVDEGNAENNDNCIGLYKSIYLELQILQHRHKVNQFPH